ncbi:hypothetical protein [Microcoleus sp. bin38.metabat.b11b12b14.051]|uniref:hypothetical protein n=1 Tax=Microcoleus sp. bin38.metabat.b11b12b14.051 TaxID=2742709 RepID=UPI0025E83CDF|nr:hypothetical protein [Microcoleus sp. bin38.metabat.b11b12b14.051]
MMSYPYWQFFVALESDLEATTRYVECCEENYNTYSVAYAQIILSAGSEVDVVSKLLCNKVQPTSKAENINHYREILHSQYKFIPDLKVLIPRYNLSLTPWDSWVSAKNPDWWKLYNNIKHERHKFYKEANLKNALFSVSGLFCLVLYFYHQELRENSLQPWPKLLTLNPEWNPRICTDVRPGYILPEFQT